MLTMFVCCQVCLGTGVKANMVNWHFLPETKTAAAAAATIAFCLSAFHISVILLLLPCQLLLDPLSSCFGCFIALIP